MSGSQSLAQKLRHRFPHSVIQKGQGIYVDGRVSVREASPYLQRAMVTGTELYDVELELEDQTLVVDCSCPYFEDRGACKHIWACILEADRRGSLAEARKLRWLDLDDTFGVFGGDELRPDWAPAPRRPQIPAWQETLEQVKRAQFYQRDEPAPSREGLEILYELDADSSVRTDGAVVRLMQRVRKKNGEWGAVKDYKASAQQVEALPDAADREILSVLAGMRDYSSFSLYEPTYGATARVLSGPLVTSLLTKMAATGRLSLRMAGESSLPVSMDEGGEWEFTMEIRRDANDLWRIRGAMRRGEESIPAGELRLVIQQGLFYARQRLSRFRNGGAAEWIPALGEHDGIRFKEKEREEVLNALLETARLPRIHADEEMRIEQREGSPRFGLRLRGVARAGTSDGFGARLLMDYGDGWREDTVSKGDIWVPAQRLLLSRDVAAEEEARALLRGLGVRLPQGYASEAVLGPRAVPQVVRELLARGWHVEAEGRAFRKPGEARLDVRSGIDWFELHGQVQYEGVQADLPELLAAVRRGDSMVQLGDGTFGLLPEEWLQRIAPLANLGTQEEGHLRFRKNQAGLLDALLAAQPAVDVDQGFAEARERLKRIRNVGAAPQPDGFIGTLREYQKEGLGWMAYLREMGFGGCLADDMGVGKTAQVLAMLEERRKAGEGPSLVVAPKSLMFNWQAEAARFTPELKVVLHTGTLRDLKNIRGAHLALTTYGTLLRDILHLSKVEFDYVVLDEAQAIKNASTASAKAVRLLQGRHRLALSGTPVENHLGELWSLFEFLNPGMLGQAKVLRAAGGLAQNPGSEARLLLAQALRPFILRRTKQQVARELPEKSEQTIFCELEGPQRRLYDQLKAHYRGKLLGRVDQKTWARSKLQVLEALLRLRQAACHPGLIDEKKRLEPSAKLDVLFDQLEEIREEGHKALVFSQFTSLLSIVRERLDREQVPYEYLDGQTRDRQERVNRFQEDPGCPLFLISLKAGGLGLNLTAAEYVFLLDPWWNPAVEAQAIDRAHRIGQTRNVFAYRLIAKDTVEEKVLELQRSKRELADAILSEDNAVLRDLRPEDLELLLA